MRRVRCPCMPGSQGEWMSKQYKRVGMTGRIWILAAVLGSSSALAGAQQAPAPAQHPTPAVPQAKAPVEPPAKPPSKPGAETHITPQQAEQLFSLVDQLTQFSSQETGLPIKSTVKRQLTTRTAVESYLNEKFQDDEGAKRLQRGEIVLKKFGMLDRDFDLKPFLLALLKEQIGRAH